MSNALLDRVLDFKPNADWQINTHVSLRHRFVYFQVCKAASSTVVQRLQEVALEDIHWTVRDPHDKRVSPLLSPYQLPDDLMVEALLAPSWRRFTFVRNPFDRLLSCYLHRLVAEPDSASARSFRRYAGDDEVPSFARFIDVVSGQESAEMERHWRVQADEVLSDLVDLDFVGKVEQLETDLQRLWRVLFDRTQDDAAGLADVNASPMTTGASQRRLEHYDDSLVEAVVSRYEKDFTRFGYARSLTS